MPGSLFARAVHISQAKIGPGGPLFTPYQLSRDSTREIIMHAERRYFNLENIMEYTQGFLLNTA